MLTVTSVGSRAMEGLRWSYAGMLATAVTQVAVTSITARLLAPQAFGLFAMSAVILRFGSYFSQMGIGPALIQKAEISKEDVQASFVSSMVLGCILTAIVWISSPAVATAFADQSLIPILRTMSLSFLITSFSVTPLSLLRRNLSFKISALIEFLSFFIGAGFVGIFLAYYGFGVWSLVWSSLVQAGLVAIGTFAVSPHPLTVRFNWNAQKKLLFYGSRFSLTSFLEFVTYNLDTVLIGRLAGSAMLGIYNRANLLIQLSSQYVSATMVKVLFPSFSRIQQEVTKLQSGYSNGISLLGLVLFCLCYGISGAATEIVLVLLGSQWTPSIPILRILALGVPFSLLLNFDGMMLDAMGKVKEKLIVRVCHLGFFVLLYGILFRMGLKGFALAFVIGESLFYIVYTIVISHFLQIRLDNVSKLHFKPLFAGMAAFASMAAISAVSDRSLAATFAIQAVVGGLLLILFVAVLTSNSQKNVIAQFANNKIASRLLGVGGSGPK